MPELRVTCLCEVNSGLRSSEPQRPYTLIVTVRSTGWSVRFPSQTFTGTQPGEFSLNSPAVTMADIRGLFAAPAAEQNSASVSTATEIRILFFISKPLP